MKASSFPETTVTPHAAEPADGAAATPAMQSQQVNSGPKNPGLMHPEMLNPSARSATQSAAQSATLRPLILTLGLDDAGQAHFEQERRRYFPARLNRIPAHVSLFHALPGEEIEAVRSVLAHEAVRGPFELEVYDLMRLGRGVAYSLRAPELFSLHAALRGRWLPWLSRQDQQSFRPHIVVQNKVDPEQARTLHTRLSASFRPWTVTATSLLLWHYDGGPWSPAGTYPFGEPR